MSGWGLIVLGHGAVEGAMRGNCPRPAVLQGIVGGGVEGGVEGNCPRPFRQSSE